MKVSLFQGLVVIDNLMTLKFKKKNKQTFIYFGTSKSEKIQEIYGNLTVLISRNIKLVNFLAIKSKLFSNSN